MIRNAYKMSVCKPKAKKTSVKTAW